MRPKIGERLRDTADYFLLAWSGDDVVHLVEVCVEIYYLLWGGY